MIADEIKQTLADCYASTKTFARVLFPERFYLPFAQGHNEIFKRIDNDSQQQSAIAAPRGFGKTSLINLAYPAKKILFQDKKFIVMISCTATQAVMQSENLKRELQTNLVIRKLFGPIRPQQGNPIDDFSKEAWVTDSGTLVLPRGAGQQVRGIIFGNHRPDLIIVDDLEDKESVSNELTRKKLKEWFFEDVMNSVNRHRKDWKVVFLGTLLHEDSLLANLLESSKWNSVRLELFDDEYKSQWQDYMDDSAIRALVEEYREEGLLDSLYREYRNMSISTEDSSFSQHYFRYYDEGNVKLNKEVENVVIIDPAKTVKLHSAESAIIGVGIDLANNKIFVRDVEAKKFHPDILYDHAIEMALRINAKVIAPEVTSLHEFITYPLKNEILRRGLFFEVVELSAVGKKEDRAAWLVPFYRKGLVYHNKSVCGPLEAQLLSFPRNKRWDCLDALAYVVKLMEEGERYFHIKDETPSNEEEMKEKELDEEPVEDYEEDSDFGDVVVGSGAWRTV